MAQHPMPVLTYIFFTLYLLSLTLLTIALSLSTLRIRSLLHANPRSVTLLLPITLNVSLGIIEIVFVCQLGFYFFASFPHDCCGGGILLFNSQEAGESEDFWAYWGHWGWQDDTPGPAGEVAEADACCRL